MYIVESEFARDCETNSNCLVVLFHDGRIGYEFDIEDHQHWTDRIPKVKPSELTLTDALRICGLSANILPLSFVTKEFLYRHVYAEGVTA